MLERNKIYNMDCLDGLKKLPDKCADLIIMDPPYFFGEDAGPGGGMLGQRPHTKEVMAMNEPVNTAVLDQCLRVLKTPNLYIWCNKTQIGGYISYFESKGCNTDLLTWHKNNPMPAISNHYLPDTEYCLFFSKGAQLYGNYKTMRKYWITDINVKDKRKYGHPTIKPLEIIRLLIQNSTLGGGLVIDPYLGSGTSAVACKTLGRDYIGFEINPEYYQIANARLSEVKTTLDAYIGVA